MNKAIFLDRDGTINIEKKYLYKIKDFEFLPGVIEGLKLLQNRGFLLIVITNQSGIGRGYYSEEDFMKLNVWMLNLLKLNGVIINHVYYCPHHPNAIIDKYRRICSCRKPALGMYEQAVQEYNICLEESFAVGDKIRDCTICKKTSCRGYLISDNENEKIIEDVKNGKYVRVKYKESLLDAAIDIINRCS